MVGYITDPANYKAEKQIEIISYKLPIEAAEGVTGTVEVAGTIADYSNYMLRFDDQDMGVYAIKEQGSTTNKTTALVVTNYISALNFYKFRSIPTTETVTPAYFLMDRDGYGILTYKTSPNTTEGHLASHGKYMPAYYEVFCGELSDSEFYDRYLSARLPTEETELEKLYLSKLGQTTASGTTYNMYLASVSTALNYLQNFGFSYKFRMGKKVWSTTPSYTKTCAQIEIIPHDITNINAVVLGDGNSELVSADYDNGVISACIVFTQNMQRTTPSVRYLANDLTISDSSLSQRQGEVGYAIAADSQTASITAAAKEVFDKNTWSHKIVFKSKKEFHIGQPIRLALAESVIDSTISQVMLENGDKRFIYTCGELAATASEKITANDWHYGRRTPRAAAVGAFYIT